MIDEYKKLDWNNGTFKVEIELPVEFKRDFVQKGMCGNPNKMAECFDRILSAIRCKDVSSIWNYEREIIEVMKIAMENAVLSSSEKPNKWIKADVLDKIVAEITEIKPIDYDGTCIDRACVLQIIDKYKAESEASDADSD